MKINLNNIKGVIFDFDDTLAIHKDKDYIKHRNENEVIIRTAAEIIYNRVDAEKDYMGLTSWKILQMGKF